MKEAWKVAGYLGADGAKVVLGSVMDLPSRRNDPYDANWRGANRSDARGDDEGLKRAEDWPTARKAGAPA